MLHLAEYRRRNVKKCTRHEAFLPFLATISVERSPHCGRRHEINKGKPFEKINCMFNQIYLTMKKKHFLVLAATIVAVVGTALLASCEKEEITQTPTLTPQEKGAPITGCWVPIPFTYADHDVFRSVCFIGKQYLLANHDHSFRVYYCESGDNLCKFGCDGYLFSLPNYDIGDVMAISRNAEGSPERLYYIFDNEVLKEEGITLGNVLELPYDVPIQNSYRLNLASDSTTLLFPAGEYALTHNDRAIYFSMAIDSLIRDTNLVIFQ